MNLANILATGVLVTMGFTVGAQTQPQPAASPTLAPTQSADAAERHRHHHGRMDPGQRQERFARRMDALKQKLQIKPTQEAAWTSFTTALKPPATRQRVDREALARLNTPDRIDHLRALRDERIAQMDRRSDAVKAFYATLDNQQKKTFDEAAVRGARRGGHHHRG